MDITDAGGNLPASALVSSRMLIAKKVESACCDIDPESRGFSTPWRRLMGSYFSRQNVTSVEHDTRTECKLQ